MLVLYKSVSEWYVDADAYTYHVKGDYVADLAAELWYAEGQGYKTVIVYK